VHQQPARRYIEDDVEYKLAVLDGAGFDDTDIEPCTVALTAAEPACRQSREAIAYMVVRGSQVADDEGVRTSILELLEAIPLSVSDTIRPTGCAEIVASIIMLMS
jgi:hypothetical protein